MKRHHGTSAPRHHGTTYNSSPKDISVKYDICSLEIMIKRLYNNFKYFGIILVFISLIIFMFLEIKNNRFELVDYEVYYKAAHRILNGENLYTFSDGHYRYKYSPVAAVYFIPISFIPLNASKFVYWIFSALVITLLHLICIKLLFSHTIEAKTSRINNIVILAGICLSVHYMFDIHLGQVNFILFLLYGLMIYFYVKQREYLWPLILAISLFIKPFGLIFLPYLILKKKYKQIAVLFGCFFVLALIPVIFYGLADTIDQYHLWFKEMGYELTEKRNILATGNHTIFSIIGRYTPIRLIEFTPLFIRIYQAIILLLVGFFVLWFINKRKTDVHAEIPNFALMTGIIPLLAFTDLNSFGALFLIVYYVIGYFKKMNITGKVITVTGLFLTSANIYDIWGDRLFALFKELSIISIGTVMLIISLTILRHRQII